MDKNSSIAVGLVLRNENEIFGDRAEEHLGDLDPVGTSWKEEKLRVISILYNSLPIFQKSHT